MSHLQFNPMDIFPSPEVLENEDEIRTISNPSNNQQPVAVDPSEIYYGPGGNKRRTGKAQRENWRWKEQEKRRFLDELEEKRKQNLADGDKKTAWERKAEVKKRKENMKERKATEKEREQFSEMQEDYGMSQGTIVVEPTYTELIPEPGGILKNPIDSPPPLSILEDQIEPDDISVDDSMAPNIFPEDFLESTSESGRTPSQKEAMEVELQKYDNEEDNEVQARQCPLQVSQKKRSGEDDIAVLPRPSRGIRVALLPHEQPTMLKKQHKQPDMQPTVLDSSQPVRVTRSSAARMQIPCRQTNVQRKPPKTRARTERGALRVQKRTKNWTVKPFDEERIKTDDALLENLVRSCREKKEAPVVENYQGDRNQFNHDHWTGQSDLVAEGIITTDVAKEIADTLRQIKGKLPITSEFVQKQKIARFKEYMCYPAHEKKVSVIRFCPTNRNLIASSDARFYTCVYDMKEEKVFANFLGHKTPINDLRWSRCGQYIVTASDDCCIKIWDVHAEFETHWLRSHERQAISATFSYDRNMVISVGMDGEMITWDLRTAKAVQMTHIHQTYIKHVEVSPNGMMMGTCDVDGIVKFWDLHYNLGANLEQLEFPQEDWGGTSITSMRFGSDFEMLLTRLDAAGEPFLELHDIQNHELIEVFVGENNEKEFFAPSFYKNDYQELILAGTNQGNVLCWEKISGDLVRTVDVEGEEYSAEQIRIWKKEHRDEEEYDYGIRALDVHPDPYLKMFACSGHCDRIKVFREPNEEWIPEY